MTLGFALLLLACAPAGASAAAYTVNTTAEGADATAADGTCETVTGNGVCTLRAAVEEAGSVNFGPPNTVIVPSGTYDITSALPVNRDTEIAGAGSAETIISGNLTDQLIKDAGTNQLTKLSLSGLTLTGGAGAAGGLGTAVNLSGSALTNVTLSGVRVTGNNTKPTINGGGTFRVSSGSAVTTTVSSSRFDNNRDGSATMTGGGTLAIEGANVNHLVVSDSTFDSNTQGGTNAAGRAVIFFSASSTSTVLVQRSSIRDNTTGNFTFGGAGGALATNAAQMTVTVRQSSLTGNSSGSGLGAGINYGGGVGAVLNVENSTVANNSSGGGVINTVSGFSTGTVNIKNSTIAGNTNVAGTTAGLLRQNMGTFTVTSSILANTDNCAGSITSGDHNLVSTAVGDCNLAATSDQSNTDPLLTPLADNGGGSLTMAPNTGSTAIEGGAIMGDPDCPAVDQRGATRIGEVCDIGAFEGAKASASSDPAGSVDASSAVLSGTLSLFVTPTTYRFDYGTTAAYGSSTPTLPAPSGVATTFPVSATVTGLSPATTYHYRLVVMDSAFGESSSGDQTFTTAAAPGPGPGGGAGPGPGPGGGGPTLPTGPTGPLALAPKRGVGIVIGRSTGTVLVRRRGTSRFIRLAASRIVAPGSEIDTRKGSVTLTSARDAKGTPQTAVFRSGRFVVTQARNSALTQLALSGTELKPCGRLPVVRASASALTPLARRKVRRRLFGSGKGSFSTKGKYGSATVRGTKWSVSDSCDRTRVSVTQGTVNVRDFVKRRTVRVRAGRSYTALAPRR